MGILWTIIFWGIIVTIVAMISTILKVCFLNIDLHQANEKSKVAIKIKNELQSIDLFFSVLFLASVFLVIVLYAHNWGIEEMKREYSSYITWQAEILEKADRDCISQHNIATDWALRWSPVEEKIKTMKKGDYITRDIIFNSTGQELTVMFKRIK
jgi:hypothetical protein